MASVKRRLLPKVPDLIYWRIPQPPPVGGGERERDKEKGKIGMEEDPGRGNEKVQM